MSKSLIVSSFRTHIANQFVESFTEPANNVYYVFAGKHTDFSNTTPQPIDCVQTTVYDVYDSMVFGKRITSSDVKLMAPRVDWVANTVFAAYDSSNAMITTNFYVAVNATSNYYIFKCLDNAGNSVSTAAPDFTQTSADDEYYSTIDNYVWKYMYTVPVATWNKFVTSDFMPVVEDANVTGNAVSGAIDVIRVESGGSGYVALINNTFSATQISVGGDPTKFELPITASSNNDFYTNSLLYITAGTGAGQYKQITDYNAAFKRITVESAFSTSLSNTSVYEIGPAIQIVGNGDDAAARALVNTAANYSIYKIQILDRGLGYSYANLAIGANTGGVSNTAVLVPIFSPNGGHGSNVSIEIGATAVGLGLTFANNESGKIPTENDIRTIGILKDPLYANVVLTMNASSVSGTFTAGETVLQTNTSAVGVVTSFLGSTLLITNVDGDFTTGKVVTGGSSGATGNVHQFTISGQSKDFTTFDQRSRYTVQYISGTFQPDEPIYQSANILANGQFHSNDSNFFNLTDVKGVLNSGELIVGNTSLATANVTGSVVPDLVKYSGDIIYIENTANTISRSNTQSETIKIVLKF